VYHMILATDNRTSTKIMSDLFTDAAKRIPKMAEDALAQQREIHQERLFEMEVDPYIYEAPWDPEGGHVDPP